MRASLLVFVVSLIARAAAPVNTLANFPNSMVYAVETDTAGNIYVAGLLGNFDKANPFVAKLSPTGQTLYNTVFAGSDFGIAWGVAADSSGNAYVFGTTRRIFRLRSVLCKPRCKGSLRGSSRSSTRTAQSCTPPLSSARPR